MKLYNSYKKITAAVLVPSILFFSISFAFPQAASAQSSAGSGAQSQLEAQAASCVAQQLGVDQALSDAGKALGNAVDSVLGIPSSPATAASNLANAAKSTVGGYLQAPFGLIIGGAADGGNGYGTFPVNVTQISDPNQLAFFAAANSNLTTLSGNSAAQKVKQTCTTPLLTSLARLAALTLIQNLTEATVNWINSGFSPNGAPAYVANTGAFLANTADQVVGNVLFNDPSLNFLCQPFQLQVKVALGLSYSQPFYQQINCTLSSAIANAQNATNNFLSAGGWSNWLQMTTEPQNNPVGAFLIARANIDSQIAAKQASVGAELSQGQGALSYESCTQNTRDLNGNIISSKPYVGSPDYAVPPNPTTANPQQYITLDDCSVKTPGAIVTSQLAVTANSDQNVLELQAALGDGVDQIFSALLNQLKALITSKIQNGVLDTSGNQTYDSTLTGLPTQIQTNYNNSSVSNSANNYDDVFGQGYGEGFDTAATIISTSTNIDGEDISLDDPLYSQKTNTLSEIADILNFEAGYQYTDAEALNILNAGRAVFASAQSCNIALGDTVSYNRALSINANVVTNIDRTNSYGRTVPQITWSLPDIENSINLSNDHVAILNATENTITAATTSQEITTAFNVLNTTNFNLDQPLANLVSNIQEWFTAAGNAYTTASCPIDLTAALTGAAPAPSEGATSSTVTAGGSSI